jgi:hypothetical protein
MIKSQAVWSKVRLVLRSSPKCKPAMGQKQSGMIPAKSPLLLPKSFPAFLRDQLIGSAASVLDYFECSDTNRIKASGAMNG